MHAASRGSGVPGAWVILSGIAAENTAAVIYNYIVPPVI